MFNSGIRRGFCFATFDCALPVPPVPRLSRPSRTMFRSPLEARMSIWFKPITLEDARGSYEGARDLAHHLGIELTAVGPDFLTGSMPVDERTRQPFGLLHGGASVAMAETLGSV